MPLATPAALATSATLAMRCGLLEEEGLDGVEEGVAAFLLVLDGDGALLGRP